MWTLAKEYLGRKRVAGSEHVGVKSRMKSINERVGGRLEGKAMSEIEDKTRRGPQCEADLECRG